MTKNITLAIDAAVLAAARRYAAANNTSVNALVREALAQIASRGECAEAAWEALFEQTDAEAAGRGGRTWTRGDLHDR